MSFVEQDDVLNLVEDLYKSLIRKVSPETYIPEKFIFLINKYKGTKQKSRLLDETGFLFMIRVLLIRSIIATK